MAVRGIRNKLGGHHRGAKRGIVPQGDRSEGVAHLVVGHLGPGSDSPRRHGVGQSGAQFN